MNPMEIPLEFLVEEKYIKGVCYGWHSPTLNQEGEMCLWGQPQRIYKIGEWVEDKWIRSSTPICRVSGLHATRDVDCAIISFSRSNIVNRVALFGEIDRQKSLYAARFRCVMWSVDVGSPGVSMHSDWSTWHAWHDKAKKLCEDALRRA